MTSDTLRLVPLQGASNFRDLGGYAGHDGRRVRWGRLYRSDHLGLLTAADHAELQRRGVTQALDFRGADESAAAPYSLAGVQRHALHIEPTVVQRMQDISNRGQPLDAATTVALMEALYCGIVRHQTAQLRAFFGHLLGSETTSEPTAKAALVFHCTAGKDRTGIAAALLMEALGVARGVVMQDFLLTNQFFRPPEHNRHELPTEVLQVLWSVRPQYLHAAWQVIDHEHGGLAAYLQSVLGVGAQEQAELQRRYLEPL